MASRFGPSSERLGILLRQLRVSAGLRQPGLAERIGWVQSKVSRAENGQQRLTVPEVDAWCNVTSASAAQRTEALALAEAVLVGVSPDELTRGDGDTHLQRDIAQEEAASGLLCLYHPAVVPGLLQTPNYMRRVFESRPGGPPADLADRILGRTERQRILYSDKRLRFVIPETVLRWPVGPVDEQLEQLDRLRTVIARPNVELGIIPMRPTSAWRLHGFVLFDEREEQRLPFVQVEAHGTLLHLDEPTRVAEYRLMFDELASAAVFDAEALAVLDRVAENLRRPGVN